MNRCWCEKTKFHHCKTSIIEIDIIIIDTEQVSISLKMYIYKMYQLEIINHFTSLLKLLFMYIKMNFISAS